MRLIEPDESWTGWKALARLFDDQYREFLDQGYALPLAADAGTRWVEDMRRLDRATRFFCVAVGDNGEIAGFAEASVTRSPAWKGGAAVGRLRHIWVAPERRRGDIGHRLMAASKAWLEENCGLVSHEVIASNSAANRFWERQGMTYHHPIYERIFTRIT